MKKFICITSIIMIIVFAVLCIVDHNRMKNEKPVVFSTWGKKYAPSEKTPLNNITPEAAIELAKKSLSKKSKEEITNFDSPKVENVVFDEEPSIYYFSNKIDIVGKKIYKITFNTVHDRLLGPIVIYINKENGELIGTDYRE